MQVLFARAVLASADELRTESGVVVSGSTILEVTAGLAASRRAANKYGAAFQDLGDVLLTPGLVNAHSHLELFALAGRVAAAGGFPAWIGRLLAARSGLERETLRAGVTQGARRMLETGTTAVGDIEALGASEEPLRRSPLRVRMFREVLDGWHPDRTAAALARVRRRSRRAAAFEEGLSPHAPYTTSRELLDGIARLARERDVPVTAHWSETLAEREWLERGGGPLAAFLGKSPLASALDLYSGAGLLRPGLSLVHGNHPRSSEPERIAQCGAALVHCPGSHAFFEREPFPLERYLAAGVRLALGTDSAASNADVDMRRELALLRASHPGLSPSAAWQMATEGGAEALGWGGRLGCVVPGYLADLVAFEAPGSDLRHALEVLTVGLPRVRHVWVGGRRRAGLPFPR